MNSDLNIIASLASAGIGIALLLVTILNTRWLRKEKTKENQYLRILIAIIFLTLLADPIAYATDGWEQPFLHVICILCNSWLYLANMLVGMSWWGVIVKHMEVNPSKPHRLVITVSCAVGIALLVVNLFYPVVFGFGEDCVYYRGPLYAYYLLLEVFFMADGIYMYMRARKRKGVFRTFPLWQFLLPIFIGTCIQSVCYGVSTIPVCLAISVYSTILGLQQDKLMRDKLTGIYNRFYLDHIREKMYNKKDGVYIVLMADLNGFKDINDKYGHTEGDQALINAADILQTAAGETGTLLRYAGDEFMIFANEQTQEAGQKLKERIKEGFDAYNRTSGKAYALTCAAGFSLLDIRKDSVDDIMKQVDRQMYEDKMEFKAAFYERHENRRASDRKPDLQ